MKNKNVKPSRYSTLIKICSNLVIILTIAFTSACEKEQKITEQNNQNISTIENSCQDFKYDGRMLIFNSSNDYAKYVNNPDSITTISLTNRTKILNFNSYSNLESKNENDIVQDEDLASILNEDAIIQIGDYLYRVNVPQESVYVLPASNIDEYDDLVNENILNKNIRKLSTEDDVIDIVENNPEYCNSKACGGCSSGSYYTNEIILQNQLGTTVVTAVGKVKYFKAGIYFKLSANAEFQPSYWIGNIFMAIYINGPEAWWQKRPCCNDCDYSHTSGVVWGSSYANTGSKTFYSNIRGLHGYYLYERIQIMYINEDDPMYGLSVFSDWAGHKVNSPY